MAKRLYPHNRVRYWYVYELDEICALFPHKNKPMHIQTMRAWVKNGLKTIDTGKPTLIYGNDLIAYLKAQNDKGKCQTEFDQLYCMKCKDQRLVFQNRITLDLKKGFLKVCGCCRECKTKMFKSYKMDDHAALQRTFHVVDVLELYDCLIPTVKTHIIAQEQMHLNESVLGAHYGDFFDG